jgi:hypothetical protein
MDKIPIKTAIPPVRPRKNSSFLLLKTSFTRPDIAAVAIRYSPMTNRKKASLYAPIYEPDLIKEPAIQKNMHATNIKVAPFVLCSNLDIEIYPIKKATGDSSGSLII